MLHLKALLAALPLVVAPAPARFVDLAAVDPTILHDIRYHSSHNFVGRPVRGYREPLCIVTKAAARALKAAQASLRPRGLSLKVYDCYRPRRAVADFAAWAADPADQRMKAEFYPRTAKETLFDAGYLARRSGHSRGSTVDVTIVRLPAAVQPVHRPGRPLGACTGVHRFKDNSVDMGTGYDCFDTLAHTLDPRIMGAPLANRLLLRDTMAAAGFSGYSKEWWHFTLTGEPYPDTFFDFPVAASSLRRS
ncbi:D-alanyl-D-alanine dipeptidase [Catenuloplanes nepalensis]|uniref:D-alanyl-D-alanine dipeptidase n=1 Tax=Catenuloplanes nepalensis TaxID=587533 RepID=A0ABT9MPZ2_9ACTN|nr:M15 family metallopeptidase [Catenuloplanes nepalensis]MDP9793468.1 D-alanyl-D-alanine dipeptidase [Catenuloplanes nepalensis]